MVRRKFVDIIKQEFFFDPVATTTDHFLVEAAYDGNATYRAENVTALPAAEKETPVYLVDLHNALSYLLYQEVPLQKFLNATQIAVLQQFLTVLVDYFPFISDRPVKVNQPNLVFIDIEKCIPYLNIN